MLKAFKDPFKRYLNSEETPIQTVTTLQVNGTKGLRQNQPVTNKNVVTVGKQLQVNGTTGYNVVTVESSYIVGENKKKRNLDEWEDI